MQLVDPVWDVAMPERLVREIVGVIQEGGLVAAAQR